MRERRERKGKRASEEEILGGLFNFLLQLLLGQATRLHSRHPWRRIVLSCIESHFSVYLIFKFYITPWLVFVLFHGLQPADSRIQYLYAIYTNTPLLHTFNNSSLQLLVTTPPGIP